MTNQSLTQERLKECLYYNPYTGNFIRKTPTGTAKTGCIAGCVACNGYTVISINNKKHLAHRLAFLYMEGKFPPDQVDHINRNRTDNRWCNLRHATCRINNENHSRNNTFIGVKWVEKGRRWYAYSRRVNGKVNHLGTYKTHLAACYARHVYNISLIRA